jgi:hypothetical protein
MFDLCCVCTQPSTAAKIATVVDSFQQSVGLDLQLKNKIVEKIKSTATQAAALYVFMFLFPSVCDLFDLVELVMVALAVLPLSALSRHRW